ncbi:receptor-type tyrosine-protein phosphatase kappa-like [Coturnix japonica]|uniref:receptor-type tyrosine-protein phosphatase kappa-like n=1 Tax=Coturnix japonica TaxID=93934 RepID=UPI000777278E|nr:receptor-type tyrosine-protein phosphatase kappa-like [Coturnix japonica]
MHIVQSDRSTERCCLWGGGSMALQWVLLLVLTTLLAALDQDQRDRNKRAYYWYSEKCNKPQWDPTLQFTPDGNSFEVDEELQLTCPAHQKPTFTTVKCAEGSLGLGSGKPYSGYVWWGRNSTGAWIRIEGGVRCADMCQKPQWDPELHLTPDLEEYGENEEVTLSCPKGSQPSYTHARCTMGNGFYIPRGSPYRDIWVGRDRFGAWNSIWETVQCIEHCNKPQWDHRLQFTPDGNSFEVNKVLQLTCPGHLKPSFTSVKCAEGSLGLDSGKPDSGYVWWGRKSTGAWTLINGTVQCKEKCQKPLLDPRIGFVPNQKFYNLNKTVSMTCPSGYQPSAMEIICMKLSPRQGLSGPQSSWFMKNSTGLWQLAPGYVRCVETCQRPQWDPRLHLAPDLEEYRQNEEVTLSCPKGLPSYTHVRCAMGYGSYSYAGSAYRDTWEGKNWFGAWISIEGTVQCLEVLEVVPGTVDVTSTTIKLNWTCSFPDACQHIQATCRLAGPSSPPCEAEELTGAEILHGKMGTFTCPPLQPFTDYTVTISVPPSTVLFSWVIRTKEAVPQKPELLQLDPSNGTLRWKALPSCRGEIVGYQLNITARAPQDGGFVQIERLQLSSRTTEHPLPAYGPGTRYAVAVRGLTAAGPGAAALRDFHTNGSETPGPPDGCSRLVLDTSASQGTAVLPLHPISQPPESASEHQLLVAVTHNSTVLEDACSGELQPSNHSHPPEPYVAAVLNLTAPTDFMLGDGTRGHGFHNAPLHPGWDYTALLRLARRSPQAETFTCVCYSFSMGQESVPQLHRLPVLMALVLAAVVLALGIFLLPLIVRQKRNRSKASEINSTIPLRKRHRGARNLNTLIPVEELLDTLKRLQRAEIEAEQMEDESVNRHEAGRLGEYQKLASSLCHSCSAGKELCNEGKNRYKSIIPYDHCRVVLQPSDTGNDYINASYVDSYQSPRFFIAAQGPLPGTVVDFWQMVWQEKISVIVMLTGLVEQNKIKCEQYWPEQQQVYGDFSVTLNNTRTTKGLTTRIFCLQKAGCALPRTVEQFHYLQWPDHEVPRNPAQLLSLLEMINKSGSESPAGPVLVHCSAGIGRTGTFIALDFLLKMAKVEGKVDVFHCVQKLREQRICMVQTKEQYAFLYEVLLEGLLCGCTGVPVERVASHISCLQGAETPSQNNVLEKEFKAVQKFSELFQLLPCREAEKPSNQPKNRKPGILPADSFRPILMSSLNADGSPGYINAVFASTYSKEDRLIITQLPFSSTLVDFWALIWDYTCTSVVVLNQLQELDKTYVEVWPTQGKAIHGHFHIQWISEEPGAGFTVWTLALTNKQQPKKSAMKVHFWQLEDWPMQHHLPPHLTTIISLLGKVETHQRQNQDGHILVTCWDGASRSGIFCAASFLCEQIQSEGLVDVSQAVRMLKRRRRQLIKDVEQYGLCYKLALSYLNSFETYGNFK